MFFSNLWYVLNITCSLLLLIQNITPFKILNGNRKASINFNILIKKINYVFKLWLIDWLKKEEESRLRKRYAQNRKFEAPKILYTFLNNKPYKSTSLFDRSNEKVNKGWNILKTETFFWWKYNRSNYLTINYFN